MLLFRLKSSIGKASQVIHRNSMVNASEVFGLHHRALFGNVSQVSRVHSNSRDLIRNISGDSQLSKVQCSNRNSQNYLAQSLDRLIKLVESKSLTFPTHPGIFHSTLLKTGERSDQLLCKQLRLYASSGHETVEFFRDCYWSNRAGLGVWNAFIISLALNGQELAALTVFENMTMMKTHATYWNVMVACSQGGETRYAHYLLGRVFKFLAVEPSIEIIGSYIDGLARSGQVQKAFTEAKVMIYKPNQEIMVSLLCRYQMHSEPALFASEVLLYAESKGVVFYIDKSTYRQLIKDGITLNPNVKIKRGRKKGASAIEAREESI